MRCEHCQREIPESGPVYRLSLSPGHPWATKSGLIEGKMHWEWDQLVQSVCDSCRQDRDVELWRRDWRPAEPCRNCGRPVSHDTARKVPKHVVCSPDCRRAVYAALARARRSLPQAICQTCGKLFPPSRIDARFCSSPCRQRAYRQRQHAKAA
jgi:hypothetical protein